MAKALFHRENRSVLFGLILIKAILISYLLFQYLAFPTEKGHVGIASFSNDTSGYFDPSEAVAQGLGYTSVCRMPAFVPIYAPVSFLFGQVVAFQSIILLQILTAFLAAFVVFLIVKEFTESHNAGKWAAWVYASSAVLATYDLILLADSFGISLMIFSIYYALEFRKKQSVSSVILVSLLLSWSVFFRQIHLLLVPIVFIWMVWLPAINWKNRVRAALYFSAPIAMSLGSWTAYNLWKSQRFIPLIAPYNECFGYLPKQNTEIRDLVIAWGEDCQPWVANSASNFFLTKNGTSVCPVGDSYFTTVYKRADLDSLRAYYRHFYFETDSALARESGEKISLLVPIYLKAYKEQHAFDYYVTNRLKLLKQFMFPKRIDNIPGPPLDQMNIIQKGMKLGAYALFILVNVIGLIATIIWLLVSKTNRWFVLLPWSLLFILAVYLGFIEQRYYAPIHALFIILDAAVIHYLWNKRKQLKAAQ